MKEGFTNKEEFRCCNKVLIIQLIDGMDIGRDIITHWLSDELESEEEEEEE